MECVKGITAIPGNVDQMILLTMKTLSVCQISFAVFT